MKSFSEYLEENKLMEQKMLVEGFEDTQNEILTTYRKAVHEIKGTEDTEERTDIAKTYGKKIVKLLSKALAASATESVFFSEAIASTISKFLSIVGLLDERFEKYLSMSSASKEQRDAWEDDISQEVTQKTPESAPKKEEEDRVVNDDETPDDAAVKSVEKINTDKIDKEIADEVAKESKKEKATLKVICLVTSEIDGDPITGFVGPTTLSEPKILEYEETVDILDSESLAPFKNPKDLKKKLAGIKDGHPIKLYTFNKDNAPKLWTIEEV